MDVTQPLPDFRHNAICSTAQADLFFPERGNAAKYAMEAKAICAACPVQQECADYSLEHEVPFGVWGGITERERRAILKKRNAPKASEAA